MFLLAADWGRPQALSVCLSVCLFVGWTSGKKQGKQERSKEGEQEDPERHGGAALGEIAPIFCFHCLGRTVFCLAFCTAL